MSNPAEVLTVEDINIAIRESGIDANKISDGYHTFEELYEHRIALFIALCHIGGSDLEAWKSKIHSDGTVWPGWFIAGIGTKPGEQITYHLPDSKWDLLQAPEVDSVPKYDGHTPADVLKRLAEL